MKLAIAETDEKNITKLKDYKLFSHQRRKKTIIKLISKTFPVGSTVLDVGCASGDIAIELSLLGYNVCGIDFEQWRLERAKKLAVKYGQKVTFENKSFEELDKSKVFNIVLLGEVLEHFEDPVSMLKEIRGLLEPTGSVVITIPNMPSLRNRLKFGLLGIFPDNNPEHKYYFDCHRFQKVSKAAGYKITYMRTSFTDIFLQSKLISLFQRVLFFWVSLLFPKSGDTLFVILDTKITPSSK